MTPSLNEAFHTHPNSLGTPIHSVFGVTHKRFVSGMAAGVRNYS